jgi:hypothetical protein
MSGCYFPSELDYRLVTESVVSVLRGRGDTAFKDGD